ncbi:(Fe-S)-binding protein [Desulforhopalus singaporensis]|uniref:Fe-S oxidoreductase n=1 Tax=Desulforhopalus singaporensis TaxID=91360 RepID=A0A1H0P0M2_9BACT|nr:(Fe-S)-binding protein [Desulforhopalus singaporensis]SDO98255.1 Fe-S oxidoreductase [Desulforhopalus singaporensis]
MEASREIYWNVGHGIVTLLPMYLLAVFGLACMAIGLLKRIKVYKTGLPMNRKDQPGKRLLCTLQTALLQKRVTSPLLPGLFHGLFFWSFLILFIGTALIVLQADFTDLFWDIKFLEGSFYKLFSLVLDLAGILAVVLLIALLVRRFVILRHSINEDREQLFMHVLMLLILVTGFLIEGFRMAVTELGTPLASWSPVGLFIATIFSGAKEQSMLLLHKFTWWIHLLLVIGFIAAIPFTKFRHIVTTASNYFFKDLGPKGKLINLDLEDENKETFGAVAVTDLAWKDILDADACTTCERCQDRCPAYNTQKPLSPMQVVSQIGDAAFTKPDQNLIDKIGKDALWSCTTCGACQEICPASIEHVRKIVDLRRSLVLMEGEFPGDEVMTAMEQTEVNGNPLGMGYAGRGDWAADLEVPTLAENPEVDALYFVGCYGSFDKRNIRVAQSFVKLCKAAGIKLAILGKEEKCCGEPMRKMGNEYLYQTLAQENIELIKSYGIKHIVTTCPHCFNTLSKDYADLGLEGVAIDHYTVFLDELIAEGSLDIAADNFSCTYHDSCYLGRHNEIYEPPRSLLQHAGASLVEMERSGSEAFCCSAGGGRIMAEEKLGERINIKRAKMAADLDTGLLVSNCPFCLTMFEDGIKGAELENKLEPKDIAEILVERVKH